MTRKKSPSLFPAGTRAPWGQHAPEYHPELPGRLLLYDNGNRLITFSGISRDRRGNPRALFDLEAGEVNDMKISAHVTEVTGDEPARVVMELVFEDKDPSTWAGYRVYQAERMPLYPD